MFFLTDQHHDHLAPYKALASLIRSYACLSLITSGFSGNVHGGNGAEACLVLGKREKHVIEIKKAILYLDRKAETTT